jgi:hypothetical protein
MDEKKNIASFTVVLIAKMKKDLVRNLICLKEKENEVLIEINIVFVFVLKHYLLLLVGVFVFVFLVFVFVEIIYILLALQSSRQFALHVSQYRWELIYVLFYVCLLFPFYFIFCFNSFNWIKFVVDVAQY